MSANNARAALTARQLPEMTLSSGAADSLTPPTAPFASTMTPQECALQRFAVTGNAIITGGTGTLALHAARALLEHGLSGLAIFDLDPTSPAGSASISTLRSEFPSAEITAHAVDVTDEAAVAAATTAAATELGGIDMLLCFAGVVGCAHALELDASAFRKTIDVNTTGTFICAQAAARTMVTQGRGGSILLVASMSGHTVNYPQPQSAYNASKAAVLQLSRSLAAEWAVHGIRVNTLSPGYMDTVLNEGEGLARARGVWAARCPMGRMGAPVELTGAVVLLCSRVAGAFITGADIGVDGGMTVF